MSHELFLDVGFTVNEAKVYAMLLELKRANVRVLSEKTGVHRSNVYDALQKLVHSGFVTIVVEKGGKIFEAVNPRRLLYYLKEKEDKVKNELPALMKKFDANAIKDEALVFRSFNGIKAILQDMLEVKETVYLVGSKGYWRTLPQLKYFYPQFDKKRVELGIKLKQIYDYELRGKYITKFELGECKFFPKQYSTAIHIWIYGDRVVSLFYGEEPIAFMIKSKKISDGYKKYFNFMWNKLAHK